METMKVETTEKATIKPSSTTPHSLRTHHLSVVDHLMPPVYTSACLFYTNDSCIPREQTTQKLKTSLSQTLTKFYPFAGRINGVTVDCNDEGAIFLEASLHNRTLTGFLSSPDYQALHRYLLPLDAVHNPNEAAVTWPLLLVKATYFECGRMCIGICISHKLADAASLSAFLGSWAAMARGERDDVANAEFTASRFYPPANDACKLPVEVSTEERISVTKRFVFNGPKLEELRTKAASPNAIARPTRVESVTALLWRCVVAASSNKTRGKVLVQPANLRPKISSLLSENQIAIGNFIFSAMILNPEGKVEIPETVRELRGRAKELASLFQEEEEEGSSSTISSRLVGLMMDKFSTLSYETHEPHSVSSWCKLPLYKACFGWGFPVWVAGNVAPVLHNVTMLIDSNDGQGIEAWATLCEEDMSLFEQNPELLAFASPNPAVLI